jgi:hypothetical protein
MNTITLFLLLLTSILFADNPKPYAVLGDIIYNDASSVESLASIVDESYEDEIETYLEEVRRTKEMGFSLEKGKSKIDKKEYLNKLRELSKTHDAFVRVAYSSYKESMKEKNYALFSQLINNGLINTEKEKEEIMDFYYKHSEYIYKSTGFIFSALQEQERKRAAEEARRKKYKSKKMLEAEKIQRVRENDKRIQEQREAQLQKELLKKKLEIRERQKRELAL